MNEDIEFIGFSVLLETIKNSRDRALKSVNVELINLYWLIGAFISKQLSKSEWGDKTVQKFSDFILQHDPALKGFDRKNLYRMVQFYESYKDSAIVAPVERQLPASENALSGIVGPSDGLLKNPKDNDFILTIRSEIFCENIRKTILAKLTWTNHLIIISRCKLEEEREFYIRMSIKEAYSKRELDRQISAALFERTMLAKASTPQSVLEIHPNISNSFKDSYIFEFLNLPEPHNERELQKALISQMKAFILELGRDFLFIGEEYKLQVGNSDFYIDLLFYHRGLQCLVAFELKADKFRPEQLGQLNFYRAAYRLEALDRDVKNQNENPSIGILLCKDKDSEVVEYALSRSLSPAMVSDYKTKLPDKRILQEKLHELFESSSLTMNADENE